MYRKTLKYIPPPQCNGYISGFLVWHKFTILGQQVLTKIPLIMEDVCRMSLKNYHCVKVSEKKCNVLYYFHIFGVNEEPLVLMDVKTIKVLSISFDSKLMI